MNGWNSLMDKTVLLSMVLLHLELFVELFLMDVFLQRKVMCYCILFYYCVFFCRYKIMALITNMYVGTALPYATNALADFVLARV